MKNPLERKIPNINLNYWVTEGWAGTIIILALPGPGRWSDHRDRGRWLVWPGRWSRNVFILILGHLSSDNVLSEVFILLLTSPRPDKLDKLTGCSCVTAIYPLRLLLFPQNFKTTQTNRNFYLRGPENNLSRSRPKMECVVTCQMFQG